MVAKPKAKKLGRPSLYSHAIAKRICDEMSQGKSLRRICEAEGMPSCSMVYRWLESRESFREQYARAREEQADHYAAEIIELADTCREGTKTKQTKDGTFIETGDMVERSRLQIDARKWYASKVAPKKYGDMKQVEHTGHVTLEQLITSSDE
jgi:hypothetical protein